MTTQVKAITLRATYESNLSGFKDDIASIKSFKRNLEKQGIKVPIRLDLSGIRSDAVKAASEYKRAFAAAMGKMAPGGAVSSGGIVIPASAAASMRQFAAASSGAFKQIRVDGDKVIKTFEQLERGAQRVTGTRHMRHSFPR